MQETHPFAEWVSINSIRPYENNPRINDVAVEKVAASIRDSGWQQPIVVDEDGVIAAGDTRYKAALLLGHELVPVRTMRGVSPEQVRAYRLNDNRSGEFAEWDSPLLAAEMAALQEAAYPLEKTGFLEVEFRELLAASDANQGRTDPDKTTPPPPASLTESQAGQRYRLGRHVLMVGDATRDSDVRRLMGPDDIHLYLSDAPYNADFALPGDEFQAFLSEAFGNAAKFMTGGAAFYVWYAHAQEPAFRAALEAVNLSPKQVLVWVKNVMDRDRADYHQRHEPCLYGWKSGGAHEWLGGRKKSTLLEFDGGPFLVQEEESGAVRMTINGRTFLIKGEGVTIQEVGSDVIEHPRVKAADKSAPPKPVAVLEQLIENSTTPGATIYDSFGYAGSTVIAAERSGRCCRVMEVSPGNGDVIRRRWADFVHGEGCDWKTLTPPIEDAD